MSKMDDFVSCCKDNKFSGNSYGHPSENSPNLQEKCGKRSLEFESNNECLKYLKQKLDIANSTIASFEREKNQDKKDREQLHEEKLKINEKYEQAKSEFSDFINKFRILEKERDEESRQRFRLEDEIKQLRINLADEEVRSIKAEEEGKILETKAKNIYFEKVQLENFLKANYLRLEELEKFCSGLERIRDFYQVTGQPLKERWMGKDGEVENLETSKPQSTASKAKEELEDLSESIAEAFRKLQAFQEGYEPMCKDLQNAKNDVKNARGEMHRKTSILQEEVDKLKHNCKEWRKKSEDLGKRFNEVSKQKNEMDEVLEKTKEELICRERERKTLTKNYADIENELLNEKSKVVLYLGEIENLKKICSEEKSCKETAEELQQRKELDIEQLTKGFDELEIKTKSTEKQLNSEQSLTNELNLQNSKLREDNEIIRFQLQTLEQQYMKTKGEAVDLKERLAVSFSCQEKHEQKIEELKKLKSNREAENDVLKSRCEVNSMELHEIEAKIKYMELERDDIKQQLWESHNKNVEIQTNLMNLEEIVERVKSSNTTLALEKEELVRKFTDLEKCKRISEDKVMDLEKELWQKRVDEKSLLAKVKSMDESVRRLKRERDDYIEKMKNQELKHEEEKNEIKESFQDAFSAKNSELEKQASKKGILQIFLKKMDDQLKQKETQLEVKREELKSVLGRLSDTRNANERCSRKFESLQMAEKSLSSKVHDLEANVKSLEHKEVVLTRQLAQKKKEIKSINIRWTKTTAAALESIGKELCCPNEF